MGRGAGERSAWTSAAARTQHVEGEDCPQRGRRADQQRRAGEAWAPRLDTRRFERIELAGLIGSEELILAIDAVDLAPGPPYADQGLPAGACTRATGSRDGEIAGPRSPTRGWTSPSSPWISRLTACRGLRL